MSESIPKMHHYVNRRYLESWTNSEGTVSCIDQAGQRITASPKKVLAQKYFYQVVPFTEREINFILSSIHNDDKKNFICLNFSGDCPDSILEAVCDHLVQAQFGLYQHPSLSITDMTLFYCRIMNKNPHLNGACDTMQSLKTVVEGYEGYIEAKGYPVIDKIISDASVVLSPSEIDDFIEYVSLQLYRTVYMRAWSNLAAVSCGIKVSSINKTWPILHLLEAGKTALYIKQRHPQLSVIVNTTNVRFVTGSQPVVFLRESHGSPLYYPVSPTIAVVIDYHLGGTPVLLDNFKPEQRHLLLSDAKKVSKYNDAIRLASHEIVE